MAKGNKRKYRLSDYAKNVPAKPALTSRRRDPITTFARFSNFMSLGMIAAAFYLNNDDLNRVAPGQTLTHPLITLEQFPDTLQKIAVATVHMHGAAFTLAGLSLIVTLIWYRTRYRPRRSPLVACAPLAALLVIGLHAGALAYLKSSTNGILHIQFRNTSTRLPNLDPAAAGVATTNPAAAPSVPVTFTTITSFNYPEGKQDQWTFLFASDTLFMSPILFAWLMSFGVKYLPKPEPLPR